MASIGHVAVGLAAARIGTASSRRWQRIRLSVLLSGLSLLPDADAIGFQLGIPYGAPWGHRGATHSLVFAFIVALLATRANAVLRLSKAATFVLVFGTVASHGLLDALTDGGRGIALLWPFTDARYFAPWRPIPVAPIGLRFLSARGLRVALVELALFSPLFVYGLLPGKTSKR
jgi:inner membrane protein